MNLRGRLLVLALCAVIAALSYRLWSRPGSQSGEAPQAPTVAQAFSKVHERPTDPEAWTALGDAQSAKHELEAAEHAYRTALRLGPSDGLAHARLGFLFYGRGEDARAISLLKEARRLGAKVPMLDFTIDAIEGSDSSAVDQAFERTLAQSGQRAFDGDVVDQDAGVLAEVGRDVGRDVGGPDMGSDLGISRAQPGRSGQPSERPDPSDPGPEGSGGPRRAARDAPLGPCEIPATRLGNGRTYVIDVGFDNGAGKATVASLIIDTGASITVLTEEFAQAAAIAIDPQRQVRAITANGAVVFAMAVVPEVYLDNRTAADNWVAICPDCVQGVADGLLGLDLQAAFGIHLDPSAEVVRFNDCE